MIVIPMAGNSRRFTEAGYDKPKYMLPLDGESLFSHSVRSFERYFGSEHFLFIAREDADAGAFITEELRRLGIGHAQTIFLPGPTDGQADTVRLGLDLAGAADDAALTIFNIDTFRPGFAYPTKPWFTGEAGYSADGYLEVMNSVDPGFSFARPHPDGEDRVEETAEKRVISDLASTGLYWFRQVGMFRDVIRQGRVREHGELYVAPMYNAMIAAGLDIRYELIAPDDVIFCGVPAQYRELEEKVIARSPSARD